MSGRGCLIVTGGGRGIGAAVARLAAARGYAVALSYHTSKAGAEAVVDAIRAGGGTAAAISADVADPDAVADLFRAADRLGPLTALVNNAGAAIGAGPVAALTPDLLRQCLAVNFESAVLCTRLAAERMRRSGGGGIVNVSSEAAHRGGNGIAAYAAAKAALSVFTLAAARELAADGIRMNAVSPGLIDTDQHAGKSVERRQALAATVPLGRFGTAEEVARTILWLLSDEASYICGETVAVAGAR